MRDDRQNTTVTRDDRSAPTRRSILKAGILALGAFSFERRGRRTRRRRICPSTATTRGASPSASNSLRIKGSSSEDGEDSPVIEGAGRALVRTNDFYPDALFRIVSGVVERTSGENVEGSDPFTDYNTGFGEFHHTSERFLFYPAHDADVERGASYAMRDEFDITAPEGSLVTTHSDRDDASGLETSSENRTKGTSSKGETVGTPGTGTDGRPGSGPLLAGVEIGFLARALVRRRSEERSDE